MEPPDVGCYQKSDFQNTLYASGAPQATVLVSTNLSQWQNLQSIALSNTVSEFTDEQAIDQPSRFYRVSVP